MDTHVLLWWLGNHDVSSNAYSIIADPYNRIFISSVSSWEITIKKSLGKLKAPDNLDEAIVSSGFMELPVSIKHTIFIEQLPLHHNDPFDRLLISQSSLEQMPIITRDRIFIKYGVHIIDA